MRVAYMSCRIRNRLIGGRRKPNNKQAAIPFNNSFY